MEASVSVYSHSRLSTFEKCPLQYRFRYIDRIKRDVTGIEAFMGNRVHEILEHLYRELAEGRCPPLEDLVRLYHESWDAGFSQRIRIVKKEFTPEHYRRIGERCITNYYGSHEPFDGEVTIGLEERVQIFESRSKMRYRGARSNGKASRSCWMTHCAVGC